MNNTAISLDTISVLVTRPIHQASGFAQLLEDAHGLMPIRLPTLEISFIDANLQAALDSDTVIFTSVNAVIGAQRSLRLPWKFDGKIAAIGAATASALQAHGVTVDWQPHKGAGSEALLETLQSVDSEKSATKVTIIRGDSGREKLKEVLANAGVVVENLTVYKRELPNYSKQQLSQVFEFGLPDIISVTSDLGLTNLLKIVPSNLHNDLIALPIVVNSERCAALAREQGFSAEIAIADPPGDESQVTEILRIKELLAK